MSNMHSINQSGTTGRTFYLALFVSVYIEAHTCATKLVLFFTSLILAEVL